MRRSIRIPVLVATTAIFAAFMVAQQPVAGARQTTASDSHRRSPVELVKIVAPIALCPADLLAVVLPASTEPLQLVEAQRFLDQHKANPSAKARSKWDPSIVIPMSCR
jgi:hypothetical protein